ncbi:hypothetical protein DKX38_028668 [Salix brachista]|uniref:Disease resistance R13L4/SHOC-2-like LRR domain-containing protein n=1 Tax=Salix brachista TaxID=2182728 RepID=A0A5N5J749_9ROSI|nr:hypothetical protein DKX38_028668 [Salix brachista]
MVSTKLLARSSPPDLKIRVMSSAIYPSQTTGLPQSFRLYFMELSSRSNVFHGFWRKVDILHQEWYVCLRISGGSSSGVRKIFEGFLCNWSSFEASTLLFSQNHQKAQKTKPAGSNPILPVDVGVQTFPLDDEISERLFLCTNCKAKTQQEVKDVDDSSNLQVVPIYCSESIEKPKTQVPKAVEKVLAGAIRREMALEEFCAKQAYEIMQLNRLVQQCKHERECNSIIGQTREDKILRLESLMDDLGEREVLLEEIQDLRSQLQYYTDSSSSSVLKRNSLLKLTYSCEPSLAPPLHTIQESSSEESPDEKLEIERTRWMDAESKWISLAEELRTELDASRALAEKSKQELDTEKKCAEELKETIQMAMEEHARILEQYADLEEKHIYLLARHRMGLSLHISIVPLIMMVVSLQVISLPLGCLEEERAALLQLKDSLNYPNGTSLPSPPGGKAMPAAVIGKVFGATAAQVESPYSILMASGMGNWETGILSYVDGLSSLKTLDISYNRLEGQIDLKECSSSLETLDLSGNNITKVVASGGPTTLSALYLYGITAYGSSFQTLLQSLGAFPNLTTLGLGDNDLRGRVLGIINLKNLELLDLSYNTLNSSNIFQTIGTMTYLKTLRLQVLSLKGQLPTSQDFIDLKNLELLDLSYSTLNSSNIFQTIGTMTSLKTLLLEGCSLNGQLPIGLCDLNHLQELDIRFNDLSGFLPPCLANLTSLQQLDLSYNHLKIPMSLSPLYNLSKLKDFHGWDNEIYAEEDDHNLIPKFQLESLSLSGRGQGAGAFPKFLSHQFNLQYLVLSNNQIKGEFPSWLIENNTYLESLHLQNCSLSSPFLLPRSSHVNLSSLSISMNDFQGQIPAEIGAYFPGLGLITSTFIKKKMSWYSGLDRDKSGLPRKRQFRLGQTRFYNH